MHRRPALIVLAVIAAALVLAVLVDARREAPTGHGSARLLPGLTPGAQVRVTWERPGEAPLVLERARSGELSLPGHPGAAIDEAAARDVLATLEILSSARRVDAREDASWGLDAPRFTMRILSAPDPEILVAVGAHDGALDRRWIARAGPGARREVHLIEGHLARALDRRLEDLRLRRVFARAERIASGARAWRVELRADGRALVLSGPPARVELEPDGEHEGGAVRAEPAALGALARALGALALTRFVDDAVQAADPGRAPDLAVRVEVDGEIMTLAEQGACPADRDLRLLATTLGAGCAQAPALDALRALVASPTTLLASTLLASDAPQELAIELSGGDTLRLHAAGRSFSARDADIEPAAVDAWLDDLARSSAGRYVPACWRHPAARAVLALEAVHAPDHRVRITVLEHPALGLVARRDQEPLCLRLDVEPHASRVAPVARLRFLRRQLLALEPYGLREATLRRGGRVLAHLVRGELLDDWSARVPAGKTPRPAAIDALRELARLRAAAFVADAPGPGHGLAAQARRITLVFDPGLRDPDAGPREHVLELGARRPDGCLARLDQQGPVFAIHGALCDALLGPWAE